MARSRNEILKDIENSAGMGVLADFATGEEHDDGTPVTFNDAMNEILRVKALLDELKND